MLSRSFLPSRLPQYRYFHSSLCTLHVPLKHGCRNSCLKPNEKFQSGLGGLPFTRLSSTISHSEVNKFSRLASHWWDEDGKFQALHTLNSLRVPLIRNGLIVRDGKVSAMPLQGFNILDVGCGGGILSEPLARLGASVTGVDASPENIEVATRHAALDENLAQRLRYVCSSVEDLKSSEQTLYDALVMSEILEHVNDLNLFLETCCSLIKPGGSVFITTINRTMSSYALAILAAERLLNLVPQGSHEWHRFIQPAELQQQLDKNHCTTRLVHGMVLNPVTMNWSWSSYKDCNYALHAVKN